MKIKVDDLYFEDQLFEKTIPKILENAEFINCSFHSLDLSEKLLRNSNFIECKFIKCSMNNLNITGASFSDILFTNCKLLGINWSSCSNVRNLQFIESKLNFSVFQNLNIPNTIFNKCTVSDTDFSRSNLQNSSFSNSNLDKSAFNECDLRKTDFRGATNYWIDPQFNKLKDAKLSMPEAISLIEALGVKVEL